MVCMGAPAMKRKPRSHRRPLNICARYQPNSGARDKLRQLIRKHLPKGYKRRRTGARSRMRCR